MIDYLQSASGRVLTAFRRTLSSLCLCDGVLFKKNFAHNSRQYLFLVPVNLRDEIL